MKKVQSGKYKRFWIHKYFWKPETQVKTSKIFQTKKFMLMTVVFTVIINLCVFDFKPFFSRFVSIRFIRRYTLLTPPAPPYN